MTTQTYDDIQGKIEAARRRKEAALEFDKLAEARRRAALEADAEIAALEQQQQQLNQRAAIEAARAAASANLGATNELLHHLTTLAETLNGALKNINQDAIQNTFHQRENLAHQIAGDAAQTAYQTELANLPALTAQYGVEARARMVIDERSRQAGAHVYGQIPAALSFTQAVAEWVSRMPENTKQHRIREALAYLLVQGYEPARW